MNFEYKSFEILKYYESLKRLSYPALNDLEIKSCIIWSGDWYQNINMINNDLTIII